MRIRFGELADKENLSALAIQVWLHTYATKGISSVISSYVLSEFTPRRFAELLSATSSALFVAEQDANLVGYAVVTADIPVSSAARAELATLYVQEPFIGKGIGALLLKQAERWALEHTGTPIWLKANSQNGRAIAFYAKHGYKKVGVTFFKLGNDEFENLVLVGPDA